MYVYIYVCIYICVHSMHIYIVFYIYIYCIIYILYLYMCVCYIYIYVIEICHKYPGWKATTFRPWIYMRNVPLPDEITGGSLEGEMNVTPSSQFIR